MIYDRANLDLDEKIIIINDDIKMEGGEAQVEIRRFPLEMPPLISKDGIELCQELENHPNK
jgi:hypothetical protein